MAPTPAPTPEVAPAPPSVGATKSSILQIDLDLIRPNHDQPRRTFDQQSLEELAASMRTDGVLQPVLVRPLADGNFELIAGERRWRAAQLAGLLKIPAVVREANDPESLELALIENLQREDLNPIDTASAFRTLIDVLGLTQQDVADRVGKQRTTVANLMRLLDLPGPVKQRVREGAITTGHAKALAGLTNPQLQIKVADRIVGAGLSVRETERLVNRLTSSAGATRTVRVAKPDPDLLDAKNKLESALGTKVEVTQGANGGKIVLHFHNHDEMERIYQLLLRAGRSGGEA